MAVRTNADVRAEITRAGLTLRAVAKHMGINPSQFTHATQDLAGRPSPAFILALKDAIEALTNGVQTA